uniref:TIR domain-containing protein n=1 Tax=Anabas testudineus TaxID=64144 RepID=A0AAQ6IGP9_ANATE
MWILAYLVVFIGFNLQVSTCQPSCSLVGLLADCTSKNHYWVPALPTNITYLYLGSNYISEINSTSLRDYDQLLELDLGWQQVLLIIRNNAFLRQRKLKRLVLSQHIVGLQLEPRAFAGLFNLQKLYLDSSNLTDSILSENYMEPLLSLEMLDLQFNKIVRLRPGSFFSKLEKLTELKLKLNQIERLCAEDLDSFRGKNFALLDLHSNKLGNMFEKSFDRERCGNPFREIAFNILDISSNYFKLETLKQFFKIIEGTKISHLIFSQHLGRDFSHDNLPDPDASTFEGLVNSSVEILDLSDNVIFALRRAVFSPLKDAMIIDISRNKINQINRNAFDGLQGNLKLLNLSSNLLGEIRSHTFTNLTELRVLDLSHNHIGILGYEAFSGLPNLKGLLLTGNSLRRLGYPVPLPKLELLLLGDNKLESVYGISNFAKSTITMVISNNRLKNLEDVYTIAADFERLQILLFSGNFIKECTAKPIPYNNSLKVLDLHDSFLQTLWAQGKCLNLFDRFRGLQGLNISFNSIMSLPQGVFRGLSSIKEIDLSFNHLIYLQPGVLPVSLKMLHLSNNFLASPDPSSFLHLFALDLADNGFHCNCHLESFFNWLAVTNVTFLSPVEEFRCMFPADLNNLYLLDYYDIMEPCEDEMAVQYCAFALFIVSALLIIAITLSGIVYTRCRGLIFVVYKGIIGRVLEGPKRTSPVEEGQYDAFFCFSNNDYRWVEAALLKKLDNQFSEMNIFRCCFESRDFLPGEDHLSNIRDAIWNSRKTVCIVSKEFLKDGWCLEAFALAQGRMLEELRNVLVMMVVGKVGIKLLLCWLNPFCEV